MTAPTPILTAPHEVRRLVIDVGHPYEEFKQRYEQAVPAVDAERLTALTQAGADWEQVVAEAKADAPCGFFIYWSQDVTQLMALAGNRWRCVEYLMGDHTTAERMFRHDPTVMLYAPLRTAIFTAGDDRARFAIDQPSTRFSSFDNPAIAEIGRELDGRLATLLEALAAPVPDTLRNA